MIRPGLVVVISSPSGTGKTTICRELIKKHKDFQFSISATTRPPRKNERNGIDYYFMTPEEFQKAKKAGNFIESAKYLNHWYGTPIAPLNEKVARGKVVLLDIDIQGGRALKRKLPQSVAIFVVPPSLTELKRRLKGRLTENAESRNKRLKAAIKELKSWIKYDYLVVNDDLSLAVDEISMIINVERFKISRLADKRYWKKSLITLLGLAGTRR
jgi:guanylate kinase